MFATGDMHKSDALHQFLIIPHLIPHLKRVLNVVDIQHKETIQMTISQPAMSEHPTLGSLSFIKLTTCKDKCRQIILDLLSKSQQFLRITFLLPCLFGSFLF